MPSDRGTGDFLARPVAFKLVILVSVPSLPAAPGSSGERSLGLLCWLTLCPPSLLSMRMGSRTATAATFHPPGMLSSRHDYAKGRFVNLELLDL